MTLAEAGKMAESKENLYESENLIDLVAAKTEKSKQVEGLLLGRLTGFDSSGSPMVDHDLNATGRPVRARATVDLSEDHIHRDVALMFEGNLSHKPIIIGLMSVQNKAREPAEKSQTTLITGDKEIILQCGDSSIHMKKDGKIVIKGKYILSQASGSHKIKGGMIQLN